MDFFPERKFLILFVQNTVCIYFLHATVRHLLFKIYTQCTILIIFLSYLSSFKKINFLFGEFIAPQKCIVKHILLHPRAYYRQIFKNCFRLHVDRQSPPSHQIMRLIRLRNRSISQGTEQWIVLLSANQ